MQRAIAFINQKALRHNASMVKRYAPNSHILAMLKANAYGHSMVSVAKTICDRVDAFGVATLNEALHLREALPGKSIVLFSEPCDLEMIQIAAEKHMSLVLYDIDQIAQLNRVRKPISVWIKVNTGMNRLGFLPSQIPDVLKQLKRCQWIQKPIHLMTHFANADQVDDTFTSTQSKLFEPLMRLPNLQFSLANSAAILHHSGMHHDWVRPGIMLYGISPIPKTTASDYQLKPVMTLQSRLIAIQDCERGDRVGYGGHWVCDEPTRIGIVSIGYGDGYPRHAKNGTPVLLNDKRSCLVGRVSMDMLAINLNGIPDLQIGMPVTLWGEGLPIEEIAEWADTIPYTLCTQLTERVVRELV